MSNSTTTSANTNYTTTTTSSPDAVDGAATNDLWQNLRDLYSGNTAWYDSLAAYLVTGLLLCIVLCWVCLVLKYARGGSNGLLMRGTVGADFAPLPQIVDASDEAENDVEAA